jgi:hypothetical protein
VTTDLLAGATATISPCGRYRYDLTRMWGEGPVALWVMLNPSIADAERDDHTIRRCIFYSKREGMGGLVVVNLFAWRATKPSELLTADDPVGPENTATINRWLTDERVGLRIVAWGANRLAEQLGRPLWRAASGSPDNVLCLGRTTSGAPRHPARLPNDQPLEVYA